MKIDERFKKQASFLGEEGQKTLRETSLVIGGCSGAGTPLALFTALLGVGSLTLIDFDILEASNLNRFLLGGPEDLGRKKVEVAKKYLQSFVPSLDCKVISKSLKSKEAIQAIKKSDGILLGVDSENVREFIMEKCWQYKKPILDIASRSEINQGRGPTVMSRVMFWAPRIEGGCLLCLGVDPDNPSPSPPTSLVLPNVQVASEASLILISYLTGLSDLHEKANLVYYDLLKPEVKAFKVVSQSNCPICGTEKGD